MPDLDAIPADVAKRAKILWINYPNNPTAALAAPGFYEKVVAFAQKNDVIVASDLAYSEMYYESPPPSFLETPGAREFGIEFHSLSKTYNMTGWRVGWACGNAKLVGGLGQVKTTSTRARSTPSSAPPSPRWTGYSGLRGAAARHLPRAARRPVRRPQEGGLRRAGAEGQLLHADRQSGRADLDRLRVGLATEAGIVATPATGFGAAGEGFVRMTVCADKARLAEAVDRALQAEAVIA